MRALILIDLQNDFLPGGALAVKNGDEVLPVANRLSALKGKIFDLVVATQDWHPQSHGSFASNNPERKIGELSQLGGLPQVMWPDHCVQGTSGAEFSDSLDLSYVDKIVQKGTDPLIDSYSGFYDNGHKKQTELGPYLKSQNVNEITLLGLATDYCVKFTALDAIQEGFKTICVVDGCRAVNLKAEDERLALEEMQKVGVYLTTSQEVIRLAL